MAVLVKESGFVPDDWGEGYVPLAALARGPGCNMPGALGVDLSSPELEPGGWQRLCEARERIGLIRVRLREFGDLAAFDLARALRAEGYAGRLRAHGAVLAGFYTLTRRAGFDEVELAPLQAGLQPGEHWRNERHWQPRLPQASPPDPSADHMTPGPMA